jgi:hypothetical protein
VVVQGHFTAPAKRLRAEHRRRHAERRPHGQFRPQRRKSRPPKEQSDAAIGDPRPGRSPICRPRPRSLCAARRPRRKRRSAESCAIDMSHACAVPVRHRWPARKTPAGIAGPSGPPKTRPRRRCALFREERPPTSRSRPSPGWPQRSKATCPQRPQGAEDLGSYRARNGSNVGGRAGPASRTSAPSPKQPKRHRAEARRSRQMIETRGASR